MVRQGEAGRAQTDHENLVARVFAGHRPRKVQRIPARQQAIDLEAPGQVQNIFERARFHLRNVHRLLLLEDAALHAVVADAMAGAGAGGVIDGDNRQGTNRVAVLLDEIHLGYFFIERTSGEHGAEHGHLKGAVLLFEARGATVFALVVALDAVVGLVERTGQVGAGVGKVEAFAMTPFVLGQGEARDAIHHHGFHGNQVFHIELVRHFEQHIATVLLAPGGRQASPGRIAGGLFDLRLMVVFGFKPTRDVVDKAGLSEAIVEEGFQLIGQRVAIDRHRLFLRHAADGALRDELAFEGIERGQGMMTGLQFGHLRSDAEELADEVFDVRRQGNQQLGVLLPFDAVRMGAPLHQGVEERQIGGFQMVKKDAVETRERVAVVEIGEVEVKGKVKRFGGVRHAVLSNARGCWGSTGRVLFQCIAFPLKPESWRQRRGEGDATVARQPTNLTCL